MADRRSASSCVRLRSYPRRTGYRPDEAGSASPRACSWKSSVPLSVMTNCLAGASCQAKAPPEAVSSKEIVVVAILPLNVSPRSPGSRSITPSSKCEFRSSPVHIRTHRIMALLLFWLPPLVCATRTGSSRVRLGGPKWNDGFLVKDGVHVASKVARRVASNRGRRTVSSVNNMSAARSEKRPSCVVNSSAPLSVMTSCRAGSRTPSKLWVRVRLVE